MRLPICIVLVAVIISSCGKARVTRHEANTGNASETVPGTLIAADSVRIKEDKLNDFWFSVRINSGSPASDAAGVYDIHARFGNAEGEAQFSMPRGAESLRPLLRRDSGYIFTIGFVPGAALGGDTAFHEYYRVSGSRSEIKIAALKAYSIQ